MKVKLGQIQEMKEPLARLSNETLPLKLAFKLNKLIRAIDENLVVIEEERVKMVQRLGEADETGNVSVPKDNIPTFHKEYTELMQEEVELFFDKFKLDDLASAKITTQDMLKLELIFEE